MESALLWTFSVIYVCWLLLTLVRASGRSTFSWWQIPRQIWVLLPNWRLFAPKPGVADYYVYYRDQRGTEAPGAWQVAYGPEARKWFHGLWYPNKVQAKAVSDLVQQLAGVIMEMQQGEEEKVMKSAPYLQLFHFVLHLPRPQAQDQTQFSIVVHEPAHQYEATMLTSPFYAL